MAIADKFTERLLKEAGLAPGKRVLDIGSGHGAVTRMAADIVGTDGYVLGIDISKDAVQSAREITDSALYPQIRYQTADLNDFDASIGRFDAVIGRRVLMYLPDLEKTLRAMSDVLNVGGAFAFQEHDSLGAPASVGDAPMHYFLHDLMWRTVRSEAPTGVAGLEAVEVFARAGLKVDPLICEANIITPDQTPDITAIVRAMAGRMEKAGLAAADDLKLDTLPEILAEERREAGPILWELICGLIHHKGAKA